jgi:hypothetical protein
MFEVGDRVRYLGIESDLPNGQRNMICVGEIYTVSDKFTGFWFGNGTYNDSTIAIALEEEPNYCYPIHGFEMVEASRYPSQNVRACISEIVKSRPKRRKRA